jgi:ABC-type branched-subunit amino acid transport system substrate-binding protein
VETLREINEEDKMKRRNWIGFGAIVLCAGIMGVVAVGCGRKPEDASHEGPPSETRKIVMGGVYPMTGPLAVFGTAAADGLREGVAYANAKILAETPYRLVAVIEDSRGDPQTGVLAYRRLVDTRRARIMNAILSNVCVSLKPLADEDGVLLFADSTHSALTGGMTLRHSQTADQEAAFLLAHCREQLEAETIFAVVTDDDYGVSLQKAFGADVASIRYDPAAADLSAVAAQVVRRNPDAVILVGVGGPLGELIRTIREMGFRGQMVSSLGFSAVPSARTVAGDAAIGLYHTVLVQDAADFARETAGEVPNMEGASNVKIIEFNNAVFVARAIVDGHTTPQTMREAILSQPVLVGVGTRAIPQPDGSLQPELAVRKVE